ncbi:MAG TPA: PhnD/SsuA/transferrin family substrate-binding protein, partial [Minicystis sp.]|nr:PhnD/SsuA/transferrin family substrate-binding protein [Minicystis sp.]
ALWEATREHLAPLGVTLDYALFSTYERQVEALCAGHVDVALDSPLAHVRVRRRSDGRARGLAQRDVDRDVTARVVARRDAGIRALGDLEGKTLAVGARDAAHARILPLHFLARAGVDVARVALLGFDVDLGKHGDTPGGELEALAALHAGKAHAAVVGAAVLASEQAAGRVDPRVVEPLWSTPPFSRHMLDAAPGLSSDRAQALTRVLLEIRASNAKHKKLMELAGHRLWIPAREDGYAELEAALGE